MRLEKLLPAITAVLALPACLQTESSANMDETASRGRPGHDTPPSADSKSRLTYGPLQDVALAKVAYVKIVEEPGGGADYVFSYDAILQQASFVLHLSSENFAEPAWNFELSA